MGDRTITAAPDRHVRAALEAAVATLDLSLRTDPAAVGELFEVVEVLGPARLSYLPSPVERSTGGTAIHAERGDVEGLLSAVTSQEADESGLADVHDGLSVVRRGGVVAAAAGYEVWPHDVAHLSVLTHPVHRGRGLARDAAARAVEQAQAAGLLPQWRARPAASRRVAAALGFTDLGAQLSVRLCTTL